MTSSILSFQIQDIAFGKHAHSFSLWVPFTQKLLTGTGVSSDQGFEHLEDQCLHSLSVELTVIRALGFNNQERRSQLCFGS